MARLSVGLKVVKDLELYASGHKDLMDLFLEGVEHDESDISEKLISVPLTAYVDYNRK